jgi:hypothetical protein
LKRKTFPRRKKKRSNGSRRQAKLKQIKPKSLELTMNSLQKLEKHLASTLTSLQLSIRGMLKCVLLWIRKRAMKI